MSIPKDRGYVIISTDEAGETTLSISASLPEKGRSEHVFATYTGVKVAVHKEIALTRTGKVVWSTSPAEVSLYKGEVHVAPLAKAHVTM